MKKKLYLNPLVLTLFCLLALGSCRESEQLNEDVYDFEELHEKMLNDKDFISFIDNQNSFFTDLRERKYNIIDVRDEIGAFHETDFCLLADTYDGNLKKDVLRFSSFMCANGLLREKVIEKYPAYLEMTPSERSLLLNSKSTNSFADTRAVDCLEQFQLDWVSSEFVLVEGGGGGFGDYIIDVGESVAISNYEHCCESGGDGCPP